jgi:hypothetical protein
LLTNCTVSRPMRSAGQAACSSGNACASRTASCTASERYCGGDADRSRRWASAGGSRRENTCGSGSPIWDLFSAPQGASQVDLGAWIRH